MKEKITINGNKYELDITQAEKLGVLQKSFQTKSVGEIFLNCELKNEYFLLARIDKDRVQLVSLADGNRWKGIVFVVDDNEIDEDEWIEICSRPNEWTKVDKSTLNLV